jgi:hypothetical protein
MTTVEPGAELGVFGMADFQPGTSVMRLRIGLHPLASFTLSADHIFRAGRRGTALHLPCGSVHAIRHERHHRCRADRGHAELSVALRAAAGAALSRLSHRHVARTVCRCTDQAAGAARDIAAAFLFVLGFSTVFVALGASASAIGAVVRAYSANSPSSPASPSSSWGCTFSADADRVADAREAVRSPSRSAYGALI